MLDLLRRPVKPIWFAVGLLVPAVILYLAGPEFTSHFRYERDAILNGELWRLVTGHFVHLGRTHLGLNAAALVLLMVGFGSQIRASAAHLVLLCLLLTLGVSGGLLLASPQLDWYVGLSGVLHGLAVWLVLVLWRNERPIAIALLVGVVVKVVWEHFTGSGPFIELAVGGSVIVDAHLYGAISGAVAVAMSLLVRRLLSRRGDNGGGPI